MDGAGKGTPRYLLDTYPSTLTEDPQRLADLVSDAGWVDAAVRPKRSASGVGTEPSLQGEVVSSWIFEDEPAPRGAEAGEAGGVGHVAPPPFLVEPPILLRADDQHCASRFS